VSILEQEIIKIDGKIGILLIFHRQMANSASNSA